MEKLYTINQAAEILAVHPQTLRRWEEAGKVKPLRLGRNRRYTEAMIYSLTGTH